MFWDDDQQPQQYQVPDDVIDLQFRIDCRALPVDHLHALSTALLEHLPWLESDPLAGVHEIFLAGSQNGWERPDPKLGQALIPSRRTRLTLRVPKPRGAETRERLQDAVLDLQGHALKIGDAREHPLSALGTVFARHIVLETGEHDDEGRFLQRIADELDGMAINVRKALCGRTVSITTPAETIVTRSVLLAELSPEESVRLQQQGLGPLRHMGCGLFLPHKGIAPVNDLDND